MAQTNIVNRLAAAWHVLRHGQGALGVRSAKASPFSFVTGVETGGVQASWSMAGEADVRGRYEPFFREGYAGNSPVHAAISYKARNQSSVPVWAAKGDIDNPEWLPEKHWLAKVLARPNPYQSRQQFQAERVTYLNLAGNSYTYEQRDSAGRVIERWNLRPDRVWIVPDSKGGLKGYLYVPEGNAPDEGTVILPSDMTHVKFVNPRDPLMGLGYGFPPLLAAATVGDIDNSITTFIKSIMDGGGLVRGALKFKMSLNDTEMARARALWRERYGGADSWGDIAIFDSEGDYQRIGLTFEELGFELLDERNEARILQAFGVPPILVAAQIGLKHSTYSNYAEARRAAWEDTLKPELDLFADADNRALATDGAFVVYDYPVMPAMRGDMTAQIDGAYKLFQMGVPVNTAMSTVGLKIDVPFGDVGYVPNNVTPVTETPTADDADDEDAPLSNFDSDDESDEDADPEKRTSDPPTARKASAEVQLRRAADLDALAVQHEGAFADAATAVFEAERREVLALIGEAKAWAVAKKSSITWAFVRDRVSEFFRGNGEAWREAFTPLIETVVRDVATYWQVEAGLAFNVTQLRSQAWFLDYTLKFADPLIDTSERQITAVMQSGIRNGWSIPQMETAIKDVFDQWLTGGADAQSIAFAEERMPDYRRELIARTETTRAVNAGAAQVYREAGIQEKQWLATADGRTRITHREAHAQKRLMNQAFTVGGYEMMQPGDASLGAPVSEFANCRCCVLPCFADDAPLPALPPIDDEGDEA